MGYRVTVEGATRDATADPGPPASTETDGDGSTPASAGGTATPGPPKRPLLERLGLAAIALVLAALFGIVAAAALSGGEPFLAAMGAIGCLMTLWVGALTLVRG